MKSKEQGKRNVELIKILFGGKKVTPDEFAKAKEEWRELMRPLWEDLENECREGMKGHIKVSDK